MCRRLAIFLLVASALGGCSSAASREAQAIEQCERYIKGALKAPTTYRRVKAEVISQPISAAEYKRRFMPNETNKAVLQMLQLQAELGLSLTFASIEGDAENGFGVPIRGKWACGFKTVAEKLEDPEKAVDWVAGRREFAGLMGRPWPPKNPEPECCIRELGSTN